MNYYKRHLGDYARKTSHLTVTEHGVYTLLLDAYYDREQPPTKAEALRQARAKTPEEIAVVEAILQDFFTEVDGRFQQRRVEEELVKAAQVAKSNSVNGRAGGRPRKPITNPVETHSASTQKQNEGEKNLNPPIHQSTSLPKQALRGCRLDEDWIPDEIVIAWAKAERPGLNVAQEIDNFRDYWHSKPGQGGLKLDWTKTFRMWIRTARNGDGNGNARPSTRKLSAVEQVSAYIREARQGRETSS